MNSVPIRMIIISFLILFTLACEEIVWDNPYDVNSALDPSEWAPRNLQAQVLSDSQIKLTWTQDEKPVEGFRIERQESGDSWTQVGEVAADVTQYIDTELIIGLDYTYRVYAYTASNQSDYATSDTTSTSFPAPTNLIATSQNDTEIMLEWVDNCGFEEGFLIERMEDHSSWTQVGEVAADITQYIDIELIIGLDYTYRVYAYTASNQSDYATSDTTSTSFPAPTNFTTTTQNNTDILLEWVDNCDFEEGFYIERQNNGGTWIQIGEVAADITQYIDIELIIGLDYTYRVYAYTASNQSDYATSDTTSTSFPAPTNLIATSQNDTEIMLEWVDNCGFEEGFLIERMEDHSSWTQVGEVAADITQFTNTGLSHGPSYTYRVRAYTNNNYSAYTVSNMTSTSFPAPTNLTTTTQNNTDILLEWVDNCDFEEGFYIERQNNGGTWIQIGEVAADITQYLNAGVNYGVNYTYRVYAYTSSNQSGYSNTAELYLFETDAVTDIDGNVYQTVKIGDQWWMAENLKVTRYRNGYAIANVTGTSEWAGLSTGSYCNYDNDVNNTTTYGSLYNWYAVNDNHNFAPQGWHLPSDEEWKEMEMHLGMSLSEAESTGYRGIDEGGKMKETGTTHWNSPNTGATNESGFTALPGGYRSGSGYFSNLGNDAYFWSSTEGSSSAAWYRYLYHNNSQVSRNEGNKCFGFSVRCVKD